MLHPLARRPPFEATALDRRADERLLSQRGVVLRLCQLTTGQPPHRRRTEQPIACDALIMDMAAIHTTPALRPHLAEASVKI